MKRTCALVIATFVVAGTLIGCKPKNDGIDAPAGANNPTIPLQSAPPQKAMPSAAGAGGAPSGAPQ